jgi:four helix bundle protein
MTAKTFEDLIAWQLANSLKRKVFAITATPPARLDRNFCDQIRDSARSATRNTAEGFARFAPREFARFLRIAAGSLQETRDHLIDGFDNKYIDEPTFTELTRLTLRAYRANVRLTQYLSKAKPPPPTRHRKKREPQEPEEPLGPSGP